MTIKFKGVDLESDLAPIISHVTVADAYGGALQNPQAVWDSLTLLGQLSGGGTDMSGSRRAFGELAVSLVNQLGREALKKSLQEMGSKAQVAINILVSARFGLLVDGLGEITEVLEDRLTFLPHMVASEGMFADVAIAPNGPDDGDLIVVLRADRLHENLSALGSGGAAVKAA